MLTMTELEELIRPASELARSFAQQRGTIAVEEKSAGQFVSQADHAVESLIRDTLRAKLGQVAILGEEAGGSLDREASGWVIDPIDGTSNFLRGLPIWGVSIGYVERGVAQAGIVSLPDLGLTLAARRGGGATVNGQPIHPTCSAVRSVKVIALGENDFEPGPATDNRAQTFRDRGFAVVRYHCAVFSLINAALGRLDGYIEHGCKLWDIAAGWIICEEAGLTVDVQEIAPGRLSIAAIHPPKDSLSAVGAENQ